MADETPNTNPSPPPPATAEPESPPLPPVEPPALTEQELPPPPVTVVEEVLAPVAVESRSLAAAMTTEAEEEKSVSPPPPLDEDEQKKNIPQNLGSFKEESNRVTDLSESESKALSELTQLLQQAITTHQFTSPPPPPPQQESDVSTEITPPQAAAAEPEEVSIYGIPLLKDERTDTILLKFLRARDFKPKDAFTMIKNTIQWRKEFNIEQLINEDLGDDLDNKVVFMHGHDRDGHPVCYNVYGEFMNKELYNKTFSDEDKRTRFLRWRIQFLEKSIRMLDFNPGGVCTIFQVNDLKNSPGPGKRELRLATKQALQLLQDNYPEFVVKQVFINVPWWYLAFYTMISPFMTQRTKSKFVVAGPSKSAETLFKYISSEQVPVQYGGLSVDYCECNPEFTIADPVTEVIVKPSIKQTVEIIIYEKCVLIWELRVLGWEISYAAEFVPEVKDAYTVIIQKPTKMTPNAEPVISGSFKVSELGKILLVIDNPTSKKKKLLYRFKIQPLE
ncbi:hypothetical protein ACFE04_004504 [Oxalis oulophora]